MVDPQQFGAIEAEVKNLIKLQEDHRAEHRQDHKEVNGKIDSINLGLTAHATLVEAKFADSAKADLARSYQTRLMILGTGIATSLASIFGTETKDVIIAVVERLVKITFASQ